MPTRESVTTFAEDDPPPGESPWVDGQGPETGINVVEADPAWPGHFEIQAARIREALGPRVLWLEHVGSTAVPGLAAKPIIDIDLVVADPNEEDAYVPALVEAGFVHRVREPWWYGHRMLRHVDPATNLHVFGLDAPEPVRHRLLRDWLRTDSGDLERYAAIKREAASAANAAGETVMDYNARKEQLIREIYARAFAAAGLV